MTRLSVAIFVALFATALPGLAAAQCSTTCEATGAVDKPSGWDISLPFEEGENVRILSGYGPTMGSSLHCRSRDAYCANDWHALDFVLPDHPNSGKGRPVIAIADGEVISAEWGSQGWANYGRRVYLRHDAGDGNTYTSMYAHLDSISVSEGEMVEKGERLGTLGGSCQGADSCSSFSTPHLHFSIHRNAMFGGTGSGGSYAGRAVLPEPIDDYTDLARSQTLVSKNRGNAPPPPVCDITIGPNEDVILEEDGNCGQVVGSPASAEVGSGDHAFRMPLVNPSPDYANGVVWHLQFAEPGDYELWASVPESTELSSEATYKVQYAGGESVTVIIDQAAAAPGSVRLGRFTFDTESDQWVRLGDNYDDGANDGRFVMLDALRVFSADLCDCSTTGESETFCADGSLELVSCDGCYSSVVVPCEDGSSSTANNGTDGSNQTGVNASTGPNSETPAGSDGVSVEGEGSCSTRGGAAPAAMMLLFAFVALVRRRR